MRTEVLELKRACFCFPLRYSLILWGYIRLIYVASTICMKIIALINFESLRETIWMNIYWLVFTWITVLLDFILVLILIIEAHTKSVKLLKTFYFYDIGLVILETILIVALLIFILYCMFILNGIKVYEASDVKKILAVAAYVISYLIIRGYVLLLVRSVIMKLNNNCQFRFVNNAAESECTMKYKTTGDEEQSLDVNGAEPIESKDNCPENMGKLNDKTEWNMKHKKLDDVEDEIEIISDDESCKSK